MDSVSIIAVVSIITAGFSTSIGCMFPALGEGKSVSTALTAIAQQPDAAPTITRTYYGHDKPCHKKPFIDFERDE